MQWIRLKQFRRGVINTAVFMLSGLVLVALADLAAEQWNLPQSPLFWAGTLAFSAGITWLVQRSVQNRKAQPSLSAQSQLAALMSLNQKLASEEDEAELINTGLEIALSLSNATAASFVVLDEWEQAQPAFTRGALPENALRAWAEHLASKSVRQQCRNCQLGGAAAGKACPLLEGPFALTYNVYCLMSFKAERATDMLNLYLPADQTLPAETHIFLKGMLQALDFAIQSLRLRKLQSSTLTEVQTGPLHPLDLPQALEQLTNNLQRSLGSTAAGLHLLPYPPQNEILCLEVGSLPAGLEECMTAELQSLVDFAAVQSTPLDGGIWSYATILTPGGERRGLVWVWSVQTTPLSALQNQMLESVALQAGILADIDQRVLSLEYSLIIQERSRLAREIHDGLAQTLAFLKLQAYQMQQFYIQGDQERLLNALRQNYQALSEAYLETRHALDNLRITPEAGLEQWLEQTSRAFEPMAGFTIERHIQKIPAQIPIEVQAQLIRIVQEALHNSRKHAHAKKAWVSVRRWENELILEVGDDGQGFNPEELSEATQYGLRGMRERAEMLGADFQITSLINQGTVVRVSLPIQTEENKP